MVTYTIFQYLVFPYLFQNIISYYIVFKYLVDYSATSVILLGSTLRKEICARRIRAKGKVRNLFVQIQFQFALLNATNIYINLDNHTGILTKPFTFFNKRERLYLRNSSFKCNKQHLKSIYHKGINLCEKKLVRKNKARNLYAKSLPQFALLSSTNIHSKLANRTNNFCKPQAF